MVNGHTRTRTTVYKNDLGFVRAGQSLSVLLAMLGVGGALFYYLLSSLNRYLQELERFRRVKHVLHQDVHKNGELGS